MQLEFNELSLFPLAENEHIAEENFTNLLKTFKEAKGFYGFSHICFPKNFSTLQITTKETFFEWISSLNNKNIKNLILDLCRKPFTDELEETMLNSFFENSYTVLGDDVPSDVEPVGLMVGHIKDVPTISLDTHEFWRNRVILVEKEALHNGEKTNAIVYNICLENDIKTKELSEWADKSMPKFISTKELLIKYLKFNIYTPVFTSDFMTQLLYWKNTDFGTFKYVLLLMKDVQHNPFTGGMGQTENLKNRGKEASKRISNSYPDGHRLSYTVEANNVTFIACKGHYEFH